MYIQMFLYMCREYKQRENTQTNEQAENYTRDGLLREKNEKHRKSTTTTRLIAKKRH